MPLSSNTTLTLPIPNAHFIWYCAWLSIPSAIYAYAHPATVHFVMVPTSVFATSLLYWRDPIRDSWRRKLDMVVVSTGLIHHMYYAFRTIRHASHTHFGAYIALIGTSVACYGVSHYLLTRGRIWPATYAHASIHLIANIANLVLYYRSISHK